MYSWIVVAYMCEEHFTEVSTLFQKKSCWNPLKIKQNVHGANLIAIYGERMKKDNEGEAEEKVN